MVRLIGVKSNRAGIGARVKVKAGPLAQIDEVRSGSGYLSQNDLRLHFGLGREPQIDSIEIRWPGGGIDTVRNLRPNQVITIKEGQGPLSDD